MRSVLLFLVCSVAAGSLTASETVLTPSLCPTLGKARVVNLFDFFNLGAAQTDYNVAQFGADRTVDMRSIWSLYSSFRESILCAEFALVAPGQRSSIII